MKKIAVVFFLFLLTGPLWAKVYGPVRSNETLIEVARKFKPKEATLGQSMTAIYLANPDAFVNGNPNKLKKGSLLTIPEKEKFLALSPAQASVALFELNQKYGTPPSQKRAPPSKDRLLAQKESDNKAADASLSNGTDKNGILMPTETQVGASEAMPQSKQSNEALPKVEEPELEARTADDKLQPAQPGILPPHHSLPLSNDQKVGEDKSKAVPNAVRSHDKTLAKFAPWVGGASILAFLLIFYLLRRKRRPEPWGNIDTPEEPPIDALLAKTSKQSLEEAFRENPDRADLALRLARQYSRYHNVNGLFRLIETAKTNANLQSVLPDLYRIGKLAEPEHPIFEDKPPMESSVMQAPLEVENPPSSEDVLNPEMLGESVGKDSGGTASDDSVKEESHLPAQQKEITQENRVGLQNSAIEGPKEESNRVTHNVEENQGVSSGIPNLKGLALAKLYLEKGAIKGAKAILEELAHSGTPEERKEANLLLSKLIES